MQFSSIKTVFSVAGVYLRQEMTYRLNFVMPYVLRICRLIGSIVVWHALFMNKESMHGYTFEEMVSYLIFAQFALLVFYPFHMFSLQELVRKGTLSAYLLRPTSYLLHSCGQFLGIKIVHLLFFFVVFLSYGLVWGLKGSFSVVPLCILLLSLSLSFVFGFFISTLAFYLVDMWPIKNLFVAGTAILGGVIVPLDLLPEVISSWAPFTPFAYFSYVNVKVLQGEFSSSLMNVHLMNLLVLNSVFYGMARFSFARGVKKYEAVGC